MTVIDGRTGLGMIPPTECWRLLREEKRGRIAVLIDGVPEIHPINHLVDDLTLLLRIDPGSKLHAVRQHPMVSFEIDGDDPRRRIGWSVLVKGRAVEVSGAAASSKVLGLPLRPWAWGEKSHWIRIDPTEVTGRRIVRRQARP